MVASFVCIMLNFIHSVQVPLDIQHKDNQSEVEVSSCPLQQMVLVTD